jgi:hypothetical protein
MVGEARREEIGHALGPCRKLCAIAGWQVGLGSEQHAPAGCADAGLARRIGQVAGVGQSRPPPQV